MAGRARDVFRWIEMLPCVPNVFSSPFLLSLNTDSLLKTVS